MGRFIMILMIDHDDSFTYNLVHYFEDEGKDVVVVPHDLIQLDEIKLLNIEAIIFSPGPGNPDDVPKSLQILHQYKNIVPIFGICLGFQIIVQYFGGKIREGKRPVHGHTDLVQHDGLTIYDSIASPTQVTRYHSLVADVHHFPTQLLITGKTDNGEIMSCRHISEPIEGVQFHPEAILTTHGKEMIRNFIKKYTSNKVIQNG